MIHFNVFQSSSRTKVNDLESNKVNKETGKSLFENNYIELYYFKSTEEFVKKLNDEIIDDKDKVVKGKKDKVQKYTYKLVFNKDLNTNKYVLVEKKILKEIFTN